MTLKINLLVFLTKDSDLEDHQIEVINEHFKAYNSCIKKLSNNISLQSDKIDLLIKSLDNQNKQIKSLSDKIESNYSIISKIKASNIFKLFKIPF